ncbi:rhodanese-like domain-containing protein [Anaerobacillus sp. CMMVII]|uniref:rhodanese-like domain-containing protein n=1 Tax=Anaerobacillus sp. CMMVII TaxID=2755588 RepID=UPI0021B7E976|nr:rhodanese-like domain-containing protein [Anaerobacillus sp. CMMVII]MCT8137550.1 rhodanese-like domain-containing protein [Anaerobacillus sp. CMMVII]
MYIKVLLTSLFFVLFITTGCTSVSEVAVDKVEIVSAETDLSIYIVEAEKSEGPESVELEDHLNYIDTPELMALMSGVMPTSTERTAYEQYMPEWDFVLIDSRPPPVYNTGHINGAINIPDGEFDTLAHLLPENKDKMLIFYCGGLHCHLSPASANKALALGYTNVWVYQEGTPFWKSFGNYFVVTEKYVESLIMETYVTKEDALPFLILDSRTYSAYFNEHIPGAIFVDDNEFAKYQSLIPRDKNTDIVVYCGGFFCHKSHHFAEALVKEGYTNVKVLAGGMPAWKKAGLPTFGLESAGGSFDVAAGKVDRSLTPTAFDEKIKGANVVVLDVRSDGERAGGAILGSIHIPDSQINADPKAIAGKLPADKNTTILIHCASGARAAGVVEKVADLGYPNTFYLNNAIKVNADGTYGF